MDNVYKNTYLRNSFSCSSHAVIQLNCDERTMSNNNNPAIQCRLYLSFLINKMLILRVHGTLPFLEKRVFHVATNSSVKEGFFKYI